MAARDLSAPPATRRARRKRTDRLYVRSLGPREREALETIKRRPGITVFELSEALGVGLKRAWQLVARLEHNQGVRRERS